MMWSQPLEKITTFPLLKGEAHLPWRSCLLSGILMGAASAPVNAWFLAWIALIPVWIWLMTRSRFRLINLIPPIAFAIGYHGVAIYWITGIHPMTWMGVPWLASLLIAIFCWLAIITWGIILVSLWSLGMLGITQKLNHPLQRVLMGVTLWCGLETLWSYSPLHWTTFAFTQSPHNLPILQLLSLSGTTTVTAIIVAVNGLLAEAIILNYRKGNRKIFAANLTQAAIALLVVTHLFGWWLYTRPLETPQENAINVGIIQGNVPNEIKLNPQGRRKAIEGYTSGYSKLAQAGADAVLTPETALPMQWKKQVRQGRYFYQAILEETIPAWVGAFGNKDGNSTNSLFSVDGNGNTLSRFDKVKLVPLGEYIPLESLLGQFVDRLSPLDSQFAHGNPNQTFTTPFGKAIVAICYESAFGEHFRQQAARGGKFILSVANNDHYDPSMPAQHHAQDIMRAIETDRAVVRATNTGYSAIIDPKGKTHWQSKLDQYQTHLGTIYKRDTQTLYVRWGNWLMWVLLTSAIIIFFNQKLKHYLNKT